MDECLSNPCHFGANCSDRINGYECSCLAGYTGTNCETGTAFIKTYTMDFFQIISESESYRFSCLHFVYPELYNSVSYENQPFY